ncbi:MAG: efflux RND transporter periplasmic adaptor subunit [Candidatus Rokuibacteriota bacterium]
MSARGGTGPAVIAVVLAVALAACNRGPGDGANAAVKPRPVPVTVGVAERKDVPLSVTAIGTVQALTTVGVLSQVNGQIQKVHFTEGEDVRAGQLLFTLDPRPFEAALAQTQAALARDRAQLAQAQAALLQQWASVEQAQANVERDRALLDTARVQERRYRDLVEREFVAREQYDTVKTAATALAATVRAGEAAVANARASAQAAEASVENARATIRADEAIVESARLQLEYTRLRAPLAGRTGNLLIHEGNVVKANDVGNPMVTINQISPIYVTFGVPEQFLADIRRYQSAGALTVEAGPPGPSEARARGAVTFVNNTVDAATGMIQLKATFTNAERTLWPGQFVNTVLTLTTQRDAVVVPSQAVQTGQKGSFVFVVKPDLTADSRPVALGRTAGRETVIDKGVAPGERVVTDGQLRLFPGAKVDVK